MTGLDDMLAELRAVAGIDLGAQELPADGGDSGTPEGDPTARLTVKALRGGIPDAPIVRHVGFGQCPKGQACDCPPVRTERWAEHHAGIRVRGTQVNPRTMSKDDLRTFGGTVPGKPERPALYEETDPALTLDPLPPMLELVQMDAERIAKAPTSARPNSVDVHSLCREQQGKLHTRAVRAEYRLKKAQDEIARLKAELAALKAPAKPKRNRKAK